METNTQVFKGILYNIEHIGEFLNDKMEGQGSLICTNGNSYVGSWKNNFVSLRALFLAQICFRQMQGFGIFTLRSGNTYEGEFFRDKRHGKGKMTYDNREVYEGQWKDNMVSRLESSFYTDDDFRDMAMERWNFTVDWRLT